MGSHSSRDFRDERISENGRALRRIAASSISAPETIRSAGTAGFVVRDDDTRTNNGIDE